MNMRGSDLNPLLGRMDDEDCFGFHSEYYVDPEWRKVENLYTRQWRYVIKGYTEYSKYQDDIYFVYIDGHFKPEDYAVYIIKSNVKQKTSCAIKLDTKRPFAKNDTYIAVNRRGYFLYNPSTITLFGFDGREIYTHKIGRKTDAQGPARYMECVYIYDDQVIYSETKQTAMSTRIYSVNMLTQEKTLLWDTQKGDFVFDSHLRESYRQEWGLDLPFSQAPSKIESITCQFLYVNKYRVIAGFTRGSEYQVSYIINVDLANHEWNILDCFVIPRWTSKKITVPLPSQDDRRIFSFHMIDDTMWVKTNGTDIKLVHTEIQRVAQLRGKYPVGWKLHALTSNDGSGYYGEYYYFDGRSAIVPSNCREYRLTQNGEKKDIAHHPYNNYLCYFWCFDDIYLVPNESQSFCFQNIANGDREYELNRVYSSEFKELIQNAKQPQLKAEAESKKKESSGYTKPVSSADDRAIWAMARNSVEIALATDPSGRRYSEAQIESLVQSAYKVIQQNMHGTAPGDAVLSHQGKEGGRGVVDGSRLSLAEFRRNAPSMTGFRERLLSYRKSLPNNWDYNAFVGILLGVGGPKHGDAACMNFAIGQGDNGKNTRKTLEVKGLMSVFEKYKGKKIDETILLSDVEDEIIAIVPEYAAIRQKLHEIMKG